MSVERRPNWGLIIAVSVSLLFWAVLSFTVWELWKLL